MFVLCVLCHWSSLQHDIRKIAHTNTFVRHLKFYFFNHYFLRIGLAYGFMLYVTFCVKSVISYWTVNIVISVQYAYIG